VVQRESCVEDLVEYWTLQYLAFFGHPRPHTQAAMHAVLVGLGTHHSLLDLVAWHGRNRIADGELVRSLLPKGAEALIEQICAAARQVRWDEIQGPLA
jgi:hypothetical protein